MGPSYVGNLNFGNLYSNSFVYLFIEFMMSSVSAKETNTSKSSDYLMTNSSLNFFYSVNGDILVARTSVSVRATLDSLCWPWVVNCIIWR